MLGVCTVCGANCNQGTENRSFISHAETEIISQRLLANVVRDMVLSGMSFVNKDYRCRGLLFADN